MDSQDKYVVDKSNEWCAVLKYFFALITPLVLWLVAKVANGPNGFKNVLEEAKEEKDKMAPVLDRLQSMESNMSKIFVYLESLEKKVSNIEIKVEEAFEKVKSKRKLAQKIDSNEKLNKIKQCNAKETLKSLLDQIVDVDKSIKNFKNELKSRNLISVDINLLRETLEKVQKFGKSIQDSQKNHLKIDYNAPMSDNTLKCPRPFLIVKKTFS